MSASTSKAREGGREGGREGSRECGSILFFSFLSRVIVVVASRVRGRQGGREGGEERTHCSVVVCYQ